MHFYRVFLKVHTMQSSARFLHQLAVIFCLLLSATACTHAQTMLNVKDFGAIGDGKADDLPAFDKALEAVRNAGTGKVTLVVPDGTYLLALPEDSTVKAHLNIVSQADLTIAGDKMAFLIFGSPYHHGIGLFNSKNITVKKITVDYQKLPYTQGMITAVSPKEQLIDIRVDAGYPLPTDEHIDGFSGKKAQNVGYLFDAQTNLKLQEYYDQYLRKQVEKIGDGLYRYKSSNVVLDNMVGKRFAVVGRRRADAVKVDGSTDCLIENVHVYSAPACGYNVAGSTNITIDQCSIEHKPATPGNPIAQRAMSTNADGLHSKWCPVGPTLSNSYFTGMGDDSVNIGGSYTPVLDQLDDKTIIVEAHGTITNYPTDLFMAIADVDDHAQLPKVVAINGARVEGYKKPGLKLVFESPLPKLTTWKETQNAHKCAQVFNLNACGRYGKVINNRFYNHRVRGVLMRGPDSLIKGNTFDTLAGPAIVVSNDGGYLTEGPSGDRTIIEDNIFTNIQRSNIWVSSSLGPKVKDLIIRNNKFEYYGGNNPYGRGVTGNVILLSKAAGFVIENNTIGMPSPGTEAAPLVLLKNADEITWKNNTVNGKPLDLKKDIQPIVE